jgi:hypothetical protein
MSSALRLIYIVENLWNEYLWNENKSDNICKEIIITRTY